MSDVYRVIVDTAVGGLTGFVTNFIAVKMIFRKFLGFGGVILRTRKEFEARAAELVEDRLINHETLKDAIGDPKVQGLLADALASFFQLLREQNASRPLSSLRDYRSVCERLLDVYAAAGPELMSEARHLLSSAISSDLLPEAARRELSDKLAARVADGLVNDGTEAHLREICSRLSGVSLSDLILPEVWDKVLNNLASQLQQATEVVKRNEGAVRSTLEDLYNILDCDGKIDAAWDGFSSQTMEQLLGPAELEEALKYAGRALHGFLQSPSGLLGISAVVQEIDRLFNATGSVFRQQSLYDLLGPDLVERLKRVMSRDEVSRILLDVLALIRESKAQLDVRVDHAVARAISLRKQGDWVQRVQGEIIDAVRNVLYGQRMSATLDLVGKTVELIEKQQDEILVREIPQYLEDYLKRVTLSEAITGWGVLQPAKVQEVITGFMARLAEDPYALAPVRELRALTLDRLWPGRGPKGLRLGEAVVGEAIRHLESVDLVKGLAPEIVARGKDLYGRPLSEFISDRAVEELNRKLQDEKAQLERWLGGRFDVFFEGKSGLPGQILTDGVTQALTDMGGTALRDWTEVVGQRSIGGFLPLAKTAAWAGKLLAWFNRNVAMLLTGNVRNLVRTSLGKLADRDLQAMVEGFMGKELQPINMMGFFLGALAALATSLVSRFALPASSPFYIAGHGLWVRALFWMAVMGVIGWFTNWLAIRMIFRPHQRRFGLQGVLPRNKPRFARSMSRFVAGDLLGPEQVEPLTRGIGRKLYEWVRQDDYRPIQDMLASPETGALIRDGVLGYLESSEETLAAQAGCLLHGQKLDFMTEPEAASNVLAFALTRAREAAEDYLAALPASDLPPGRVLRDIIREPVAACAEESLLQRVLNSIAETRQSRSWKTVIRDAVGARRERSLKGLLPEAALEQLTTGLGDSMTASLEELLREAVGREFSPERPIRDLFDGKINSGLSHLVDETDFYRAVRNLFDQDSLADLAYQNIGLNLLLKGTVNAALDLRGLLKDVFAEFLDVELRGFVQEKAPEVKRILHSALEVAGSLTISEIIGCRAVAYPQYVADRLMGTWKGSRGPEVVHNILGQLVSGIAEQVRLEDVLPESRLETLLDRFSGTMDALLADLHQTVQSQREKIKAKVAPAFEALAGEFMDGLKLKHIFQGIAGCDLGRTAEKVTGLVYNCNGLRSSLEDAARDALTVIARGGVAFYLEREALTESCRGLISRSTKAPFRQQLAEWVDQVHSTVIAPLSRQLPEAFRDDVAETVLTAAGDTIEEYAVQVLKRLKLDLTAEREINSMEPTGIEAMFYSFAGTYFRKLIAYGLPLGAIFGLLNLLTGGRD